MQKANTELREYAKAKGVPLWAIADALGITGGTLIRRLRKPLKSEICEAYKGIIDSLTEKDLNPNKDLKEYARTKNVPLWAIADQIGKDETALIIMLHKKTTAEEAKSFKNIVDQLAERNE